MSGQTFAPGARVEARGETWVVQEARTSHFQGGEEIQAVRLRGTSPLVRDRDAIFLTDLDELRVLAPEDTQLVADDSSSFARTRLYLESLLRRTPPTDARIHAGHRAAIDDIPYQMQPAAKALGQLRPRILMADAVGLGKTIEVGILLTELIRRGRGRRILVVAMKSILGQFQKELWSRFTIPLVRLDSLGIQRVQSEIPSSMNPFHHFDRVIVSIDTLKNDVKYRQYLEQAHWDAIVIDECQNVAFRGAGSQRARLAEVLARTCDALILTSATPHDGRPESFASLVHLLEETALADPEDFTREEVEPYFLRRFKKDVAYQIREVFPERQLERHRIEASPSEDAWFTAWEETSFLGLDGKRSGKILFKTTLLKAFLSSPRACIETLEKRLAHRDLDLEQLDGDALERATKDRRALERLRDLAAAVDLASVPKARTLVERVRAILAPGRPNSRVVVFAERIATLGALRELLQAELQLPDEALATFHGSMADTDQGGLIEAFGTEGTPIRVLLASDAAAEGINLHFHCHHLIHYDLPWSLITFTQRNGRIDRYGQREVPFIDVLLTVPGVEGVSGDLRVLDRLVEKEEQVRTNLGDATLLVGTTDPEREAETIGRAVEGELTPEQAIPDQPAAGVDDFLSTLFADPAEEIFVEKGPSLSLFGGDALAFAREALTQALPELLLSGDARIDDSARTLVLDPPQDLRQRYRYLPPELRRTAADGVHRLSTDKAAVQRALEDSRRGQGAWPALDLLWDHHPILGWFDDQVLAFFGRHEAPLLGLPSGLEPDETLFLFQGVVSNRSGQPAIVDWFGVQARGATLQKGVLDLEAVLERTGLRAAPSNPGAVAAAAAASAEALRAAASQRAVEHMGSLREERKNEIMGPLQEDQRRLKAWKDRRLAAIEGALAADPNPRKRKALEDERTRVQQTYEARDAWVKRSLATAPSPHLTLAAVFVPRG